MPCLRQKRGRLCLQYHDPTWETEHFTDSDHVSVLHKHLKKPFIDTVFVNIEKVPQEYMDTNRFDEYLVQVEHDFAGLKSQVPELFQAISFAWENGGAFMMEELLWMN